VVKPAQDAAPSSDAPEQAPVEKPAEPMPGTAAPQSPQ